VLNLRAPQAARGGGGGGDFSLNFADTDIREVVAQILGTSLGLTYTIDPTVHGTATLRTAQPLSRDQLLPVLQTLLAQNGASLVQAGDIYRVLPTPGGSTGTPGLAIADLGGSTSIVPLRFANAEDLAKTLQPFVQNGGRMVADAGRNALILTGDPATRDALSNLIRTFDVDTLAGQSYALLPVTSGDAKDFASALQDALRAPGAGPSTAVRVIPMSRLGAVLVVSSQSRAIDQVRRIYGLVERKRRQTVRSWHVYYLQNGRSNDTAYVLQQAFTPNNVTATPTAPSNPARSGIASQQAGISSGGIGSSGGGGIGGGGIGGTGGGTSGLASTSLTGGTGAQSAPPQAAAAPAAPAAGNPLLGGLDPSDAGGDGTATMRIIPNGQNNALLIYGTPQENDTVEAMLRKLDILPLQVRIDATIAEVTLNDNLSYGTQYFFKAGLQGALSFGTSATAFATGFPGFVLSGPNNTSAALSLLQSVTTVKVLSSPQLLVLDNEQARLQVGALVPYLSQTSQSTLTSGSPVINSINYQQTGVIMTVTPRVNSGGLVTLDISQEVSDVSPTVTTTGVNSPTFNERSVTSRVVIQDGQTVGLAGLISDSDSRQNQGIPWLKDIPILGALAGQQTNQRQRTELLVLITPHVVQDQRQARSLTQDMRDQLEGAALTPQELNALPASGSADPNRRVRRSIGLQ
jgi:general secretion pathway protein D